MSIFNRWKYSGGPLTKEAAAMADNFLSEFGLDIHNLTNETLHVLDYPGGENGFIQLRVSFDILAERENISNAKITSKIDEDQPAAKFVFLFLSDPNDLSAKVSHLTTYTTSETPTIWILLKKKDYPNKQEKISSIWEPLKNAQYFEVHLKKLPKLEIDNEKWIGTKFTMGTQDTIQDKDTQMSLELSPQAKERHSIV